MKRGLSLSCTYVDFNRSSTDRSGQRQPRTSTHLRLQERIGQLERLVASQLDTLDTGRAKPGHACDQLSSLDNSDAEEKTSSQAPSSRVGRVNVQDAETTWVEGDHWTAILDGISELKDALTEFPGTLGSDDLAASESSGPDLLVGTQKPVTKQEILAAIPHRTVVDRLVSQFVKAVEIAPIILHLPIFLNEYANFWDHPDDTSILWIGLLYAMMCLGVLYQQSGFETPTPFLDTIDGANSRQIAQLYRSKVAQCLILGNYTKPSRYAVETLVLNMQIEHFRSKDTETGVWILLGITLRLAIRMGYHRDGADFPQMSPFHAEMRRRVWCILFMMDAGAAAHFGLPRMVQMMQSNTREPRNLLDEDIREDMDELPAARPPSCHTPVQYFVAKNRLMSVFGRISDLKTVTESPDYSDILTLDASLQSVYDHIPEILVMRPMTKSILDSAAVIMQRVHVALVFFKAKCILHRTYLISSRTNVRHMYSRTACVEAALQILQIQRVLDQETQADGRLYEEGWKMSSVIRSDFLLATTILAVDVNYAVSRGSTTSPHLGEPNLETSEKVVAALCSAHRIWLQSCNSSREARQAVRAIEIVLTKIQKTAASLPFVLERVTVDSLIVNDQSDLTLGSMLMTADPTLFDEPQDTEIDAFLDFSPLDLEMVSDECLN